MHVIVMAGLPGVGKSALAQALGRRLGCAVLDKDRVRVELFGSGVDYSGAQDDRAMEELETRVATLAGGGATHAVVDGRTFTRRAHVERWRAFAARIGARIVFVECVAPPEVARARIAADLRTGAHPAKNRTPALHDELRARAEPLEGEKLVVDTTTAAPAVLALQLDLGRLGVAPFP